ncbi:hypothetical protein CLU79DRAFT_142141 [Phycomyces nitens]|nr:hypothetical protein CLU79DRAFT_142141 [Phycomyces nitens]
MELRMAQQSLIAFEFFNLFSFSSILLFCFARHQHQPLLRPQPQHQITESPNIFSRKKKNKKKGPALLLQPHPNHRYHRLSFLLLFTCFLCYYCAMKGGTDWERMLRHFISVEACGDVLGLRAYTYKEKRFHLLYNRVLTFYLFGHKKGFICPSLFASLAPTYTTTKK